MKPTQVGASTASNVSQSQNCTPKHTPGASVPDGRTIGLVHVERSWALAPEIFILVTNVIERLHEEFKRRIKMQTVLPCAETAAMLFWALMASGQINMRKVDGWQSLAEKPGDQIIDLAA